MDDKKKRERGGGLAKVVDESSRVVSVNVMQQIKASYSTSTDTYWYRYSSTSSGECQ